MYVHIEKLVTTQQIVLFSLPSIIPHVCAYCFARKMTILIWLYYYMLCCDILSSAVLYCVFFIYIASYHFMIYFIKLR